MSQTNFFDGLVELEHEGGVVTPYGRSRPLLADKRVISPAADQIRAVLSEYYQSVGGSLEKRVMEDRVKRMGTIYRELATCRSKLDDVTTFGLRHAKILLAKWQAQGLTRKTIYNRWGTMRGWAVILNKHGMLGSIDEVWPEFRQTEGRQQVQLARELTAEQIQSRSDFLRTKSDMTAYFVDRLSREIGMTREHALELDLAQVLLVAKGQTYVRASKGANAHVYQMRGTCWWELFAQAAEFMKSRHREKLGWPHVEGTDAIAKYALRMSYVNRTLFSKGKNGGVASGEQT